MSTVKRDLFPLHVIITFALMFGFGLLPTFSTVTPEGMNLIGIFLGLLYGWTASSLIWSSLMGIVAISILGIMPLGDFLAISFGNETVIFIFLLFFFIGFAEENGLVQFLGDWFLSRKIVHGRPWMLTFILLFAAFVAGALVNELVSIFIFWSIYYSIAKEFGFKPFDKYSTLMTCGIAFCGGTAAATTLPFKLGPLVWLESYTQVTGVDIPYVKYVLFALPLCVLAVVAYTLIMRFVFRPDVSALKKINENFVNTDSLKLNKNQKIAFAFIFLLMVLLLAPSFLPENIPGVSVLSNLGNAGIMILVIVLMSVVRVEKKPLMDFRKYAKNISWDIYILFIVVLPLASLLTSDMTGITPAIVQGLSPMLAGRSTLVFAFIVLFSGALLTNVSNNAVLGIVYINLMCPIAEVMNIDVFPIVAVMMFTIQLAYLTPAASAPAAMVFSNNKWVKTKDVMKTWAIILPILFIIFFALGMPWANLIF